MEERTTKQKMLTCKKDWALMLLLVRANVNVLCVRILNFVSAVDHVAYVSKHLRFAEQNELNNVKVPQSVA
jgi:hypothetical protein